MNERRTAIEAVKSKWAERELDRSEFKRLIEDAFIETDTGDVPDRTILTMIFPGR